MASSDHDAKAACNDNIFNADTKDDDDIFRIATVATPHRIQLSYPLDLPASLVDKFPASVKKSVNAWFTIERKEDADVVLIDTSYPREFIQLRCASDQSAECLVTIKNRSSKKLIELKPPGAGKITLGHNEEASVKSNTKITALNLIWLITTTIGDMDAIAYEVSMVGYSSEQFNQMLRAVHEPSSGRVHGEAGVPTPNPQNGFSDLANQTFPKTIISSQAIPHTNYYGPNQNNLNQINAYRPQPEQYVRNIRGDPHGQPMSSISNGPMANVGLQSFTGNQWQSCRHCAPLGSDYNASAQYNAPSPFVGVPAEICPQCPNNPPYHERTSNLRFCDRQPHNGPHNGGIPYYGQLYSTPYPSSQPHACSPNNVFPDGQYRPDGPVGYNGLQNYQIGTHGIPHQQTTTNWHSVKPTGINQASNLSPDHIRQHSVNTHPISEISPGDFNPYLMGEYMQKPEK